MSYNDDGRSEIYCLWCEGRFPAEDFVYDFPKLTHNEHDAEKPNPTKRFVEGRDK